ncbi:hypothetical protein FA13DRAFT_1803473 [Coprinellus micaceus]|uniref:Uncharacterized protein n=1 Tax=Coprinellus micaceus TaxID=71717 RepID=A0A4Y7SA72_COPMI|nr:hypothetical protein FA13DRAFT_1803473 [Coprinellus micaceus]
MVKTSSPLVVAAHTIRTSRADENTLPRRSVTASGPRALDRKRYRVGHPQISYTSTNRLLKIGKLTPIAKNDEAEALRVFEPPCTPSAPIAAATHDVAVQDVPALASPFPLTLTVLSSPVAIPTTKFEDRAIKSIREPVYHKSERVKTHSTALESKVQKLENLSRAFKGTVKEIAKGFDAFRDEVDELMHEFEALEDDHIAALASLEEEKDTVGSYLGLLKNTEKELYLIYQNLEGHPDKLDIIPCGFSQAKDGF